MKNKFIVCLLFVVLIALVGCQAKAEQSDTVELKLAHNQTLDHPVHISLTKFAELVEEKSNEQIHIDIYPNGQIGSEREAIELTQTGAIDFTKVSASALEGFASDYSIFSLPYMFEDFATFKKVMAQDSVTDKLYNETRDNGFIGLTYYSAGERNLYTKNREVNDVSDMKNLKVRVQPSPTSVGMIEAFGGVPTAMDYGEVYTALQSGIIDAAENNETALVGNNHGEVAKYYMYTEHQISPDMLVMNDNTFDELTEEQQNIMQEAAKDSTEFHEDVWKKSIEEQTKIAKEEMGVEFIEVDKTSFMEAVEPMHEEFANDDKTKEIYHLIEEAKNNEKNKTKSR